MNDFDSSLQKLQVGEPGLPGVSVQLLVEAVDNKGLGAVWEATHAVDAMLNSVTAILRIVHNVSPQA